MAQATTPGFAERFALAADRTALLNELTPGSAERYYYGCLERQHARDFDAVPPILATWIRGHGRNARVIEIENRQALLTAERDPAKTLAWLRQQTGVELDARRRTADGGLDLPSVLDQQLLSPAVLDQRALQTYPNSLDGFRNAALERLATSQLDQDQVLALLKRLERPDLPSLPALVERGLQNPASGGFGSLPIHGMLLIEQLEQLVQLRPTLLGDPKLVDNWLRRLRPNADVDWQHDAVARLSYLERLQNFVDRLPMAHRSLKAHVIYHRLQHDLAAGTLERRRLLTYLQLPRTGKLVEPEHRRNHDGVGTVNLGDRFPTGFDAVGDDTELLTSCLQHFFANDDGYQTFAPFIKQSWLKSLFATTKLMLGQGDSERWFAMLGGTAVDQLKQRVELKFAPSNQTQFGGDDAIVVEAFVKNIDRLLVRVFAIDAYDYGREYGQTIDATIDLDGLVANEEQTFDYDENSLRRVRRQFTFPGLTKPGTYVLEFLGNGLSSRAVIQKGRLSHIARIGAAGHVVTVLDEAGNIVRDATAWCSGHEYAADAAGAIAIPFAPTRVKNQLLVLRLGRLCAVKRFDHKAEEYELVAGVFGAREAMLAGSQAKLLVRPTLSVHGVPIALELLEHPELVITARDQDGIESSMTVRDLKLSSDTEFVQPFTVPARLRQLTVVLRGEVQNLSRGEVTKVESRLVEFSRNGIESTDAVHCPLLGRDQNGWYLEVRGKNGEPVAGVGVRLYLALHDYTADLIESLATDDKGRIRLGALQGVRDVGVMPLAMQSRMWNWPLDGNQCRSISSIAGLAGQTLRVPYLGRAPRAERAVVSLLETRNDHFARDAFAHVAIANGFVELRDLPAGDYELWLKDVEQRVQVHITTGKALRGWAIGRDRLLELPAQQPLQIAALEMTNDALQVQLVNAGRGARVHVFATRYPTAYDPFDRLATAAPRHGRLAKRPPALSHYHGERRIGDEYRYILERRYQTKYPGNMLRRPGLLLNPWQMKSSGFDSDQWNSAVGLGGGASGAHGGKRYAKSIAEGSRGDAIGTFANFDFLPTPAPLLANLRPDANGVVRVARKDLGPGHLLHIVAVDGQDTAYRTEALPEPALQPRDRRLNEGLDPAGHFTEQRRLEFVPAGASTTIDDVTTAEVARYDSLAQVFALLQTLSGNEDLAQFSFLMRWPQFDDTEQLRLYSEHACHEVHFFLFAKDRPFFDRVIEPYLQNKIDKTFLDRWLLRQDLTQFVEPWAFAQLNAVEQILLTRTLPGRSDAGARRIKELADLVPATPERKDRLFRRALAGRALKRATQSKDAAPTQNELSRDKNDEPPPPPENVISTVDDITVEQSGGDEDGKNANDSLRRKQARQLYRPPGATLAYVENNYWHVALAEQNAARIKVNGFWRDFAGAAANQPFGSHRITEATNNLSEMLLALAVIDLPFESIEPIEQRSGNRLKLTAATPLLLARREIAAATKADGSAVLISQNLYRLDARYRHEGNRKVDNFHSGECVIAVAYGCQVVLTNPTSTPLQLELLLQIPRGSLPVQNGFVTRGLPVLLQPFATQAFDYAFYFPTTGDFPHFPAHAARAGDGDLMAAATPVALHVVAAPTIVDTTSWLHVARDGTSAEVLAFLNSHNLARLNLKAIAWRMQDANFFRTVLQQLQARFHYDDTLWAYGLMHGDNAAVRQWLSHQNAFLANCGPALSSPLANIDAIARRGYQHVEFEPLFHSRTHRLSQKPVVKNRALGSQYLDLLNILCHRPQLDADDWMSVTYYLLLQDRIDEAITAFAKVDASALHSRLQHDYFRCYLDFFSAEHKLARGIAEPYREYPVARWRQLFRTVLEQLDEAEGKAVTTTDTNELAGNPAQLAATEPVLELAVDGDQVTLRYQNLTSCQLSYYALDVEFSFSNSPFRAKTRGAAAYIVPNQSAEVILPDDRRELRLTLPTRFQKANVLIEANAAGIARRQTSLSSALAVQMIERYGQLQVRHATTDSLLPKVYVKVYARQPNGTVRFHKDGYTDLRGRFDYVSVSDGDSGEVERFAILVISETDGAVIREVTPPAPR
ncbi:MAG: hypothetical protein ACJA0V_001396 [Planctomycetota bacterium]|jgi:hypothetical protein